MVEESFVPGYVAMDGCVLAYYAVWVWCIIVNT
jgi:hypothetical protein